MDNESVFHEAPYANFFKCTLIQINAPASFVLLSKD